MMQVTNILPSTHVKRDIAFRGTYDLFLAATGSAADTDLEPETQQFNFDGKIYTVGGKVSIEREGEKHFHGLSIGSPTYAPAGAGLIESASVRVGGFLLPFMADYSLIGRIVSPHWLTDDRVKMSWHSVQGNTCVVVSMDPVPVEAALVVDVPPARRSTGGVRTVDDDGNIMLHLSICPFTDDFQVHEGKTTSAGTVACNYPGWRYRHKASRHAVRYIGASLAGVSSDEILRLITPDLRKGCTTEWMGKDPDGNAVGIITDSSHMRGVRADAPSPVCSFQNVKEAGSQYSGVGDSSYLSMTRTTPRTPSIISALEGIQG
ncbi:hypothetical protein BU14_0408s0007 [Porphyra umbilicalis]|uniref:Uncharacterized protein n=1 Tax=Porphyra umbilicalis TaxID=2786 RepID=A0A1X6NVT0_PORUM|nr:hypothetical protein BU14_0408s0007 [Porphyra umbilicalis]|eukprot:OSX72729.1 hypothetical protein BU14_0408s0007 [Porphyra umbilicalis]